MKKDWSETLRNKEIRRYGVEDIVKKMKKDRLNLIELQTFRKLKNGHVWFPLFKRDIIQDIVIIMRGQQAVIAFHFILYWTSWLGICHPKRVHIIKIVGFIAMLPFCSLGSLENLNANKLNELKFYKIALESR